MGYKGQLYSEDEDRVIRKYYRAMGASWCCMVLGRTRRGINQRARKLGISGELHRWPKKLSDEQIRVIRENRHGRTQQSLADEFGVHQNTIWQIVNYATHFRSGYKK